MKSLLDREDLIFDPPRSGCVLSLTGLPGGDGKTYDRSPYGNIGTIIGATWARLSSGLWYLDFDGSDDLVAVIASASIENLFGGGGTVEFFFRPDSLGQASASRPFDKGGGQDNGSMCWLTHQSGSTCGLTFIRNFSTSGAVWYWAPTPRPFIYGQYHHVVITYDSSSEVNDPELTVNGAVIGGLVEDTAPSGTRKTDSGQNLIIGNRVATGRCVDGGIALFRFYNRALSALEIQNHFNQEKHLFGVWSP